MSQVSTVGQRETDQENKRDARQERERERGRGWKRRKIDRCRDRPKKERGAEHERRSKRARERRERDAIENNAFQMTMIESGIAPPSGIRLRIVIYDNWHITYDWIFDYDNVMIMLDSLHKSRGNLSQLQHTQKSTKSKQKYRRYCSKHRNVESRFEKK